MLAMVKQPFPAAFRRQNPARRREARVFPPIKNMQRRRQQTESCLIPLALREKGWG